MSDRVQTIKPGLLVSLKTYVRGGVHYERRDLDAHTEGEATVVSRWETTRTIQDQAEYERANELRRRAQAIIRRVCVATTFGLLCPEDREALLDGAVAEARDLVRAFNQDARICRVDVGVLRGRIARDDEEAASAIAGEARELLEQMERGIVSADVATIREAAQKAKQLGAVLTEGQAEKIGKAVEIARKAAREIVKRVEKGKESLDVVLGDLNTTPIESARFAFLDLEGEAGLEGERESILPPVNLQRIGGLFALDGSPMEDSPADESEVLNAVR